MELRLNHLICSITTLLCSMFSFKCRYDFTEISIIPGCETFSYHRDFKSDVTSLERCYRATKGVYANFGAR